LDSNGHPNDAFASRLIGQCEPAPSVRANFSIARFLWCAPTANFDELVKIMADVDIFAEKRDSFP
jgi:hypothetical protein